MSPRKHQRGITLVLIAIAMLALIGIAGLALDVGHLVLDQSRLQATTDAAAVTGAKVLDNTGSVPQAYGAILNVFAANAAQDRELAEARIFPRVQFSRIATPFIPGGFGARYVRVEAEGFGVAATLSRVFHFHEFTLGARAIAGPSPTLGNACNVAPLALCGTVSTPGLPVYGYYVGQIVALQLSTGTPQASLSTTNYLTLSSGTNSEDQDFAGAYAACGTTGGAVPTQTGTVFAPIAQGLDTRFNEYTAGDLSSAAYPPDVVITQPMGADRLQCLPAATCAQVVTGAGQVITNSAQYPNYSYEGMYLPRVRAGNYDIPPAPGGIGVVNRRVLAVPVTDCTVSNAAGGNLPVLGFACVYTVQDVDPTTGQVFGEVLQNCQVNGTPGAVPNNAPGPYSIQLYHIQGSPQS
jgi:Flp pilus assembly protein TadG